MSAGLANLNFGYFDNWLFTFSILLLSGLSAFIMPSIGGTITNYFNVNTTIFGLGFILSLVLNYMEHRG